MVPMQLPRGQRPGEIHPPGRIRSGFPVIHRPDLAQLGDPRLSAERASVLTRPRGEELSSRHGQPREQARAARGHGRDWEAWLLGPRPGGVLLRLRKKATTEPGITYAEALDVALCFGWIDGQSQSLDADYHLRTFTPRRPRSIWSKVNIGHVTRLIEEGRMRPKASLRSTAPRQTDDGTARIGNAMATSPWSCRKPWTQTRKSPKPSLPSPRRTDSRWPSASPISSGPTREPHASPTTSTC